MTSRTGCFYYPVPPSDNLPAGEDGSGVPSRHTLHRASAPVRMNFRLLVIGFLAATIATACDDSFLPIEPSGLQFSILGYLDASADTQWIRVTPIRPVATTSPDPLAARVTLQDLGTNHIIELRDSVFRFNSSDPDLGSDGVYLHNYWTTERIEPGATYRLSVASDGEEPAEAVVQVPSDYDVEAWFSQRGQPNLLRLTGLEHVGLVFLVTHFIDQCGPGITRTPVIIPAEESDIHSIPIRGRFPERQGCGITDVDKQDLWVAGSGAQWPSGMGTRPEALGTSDIPSNISNSVGFLAGVLTKSIPYENCRIDVPQPPEYCRLRYVDGWATLQGTVVDPRCGDNSTVRDAMVELRELDPEVAEYPRTRPTTTNDRGKYLIRGLDAGRRYALRVRKPSPNRLLDFHEHTDTLDFALNEILTYNVELQRKECP